jgi:hypothetical protein
LRGKKTSSQVFKEIEPIIEAEKSHKDLDKLTINISLKHMTLEQKIQEAAKPLYLKRYE